MRHFSTSIKNARNVEGSQWKRMHAQPTRVKETYYELVDRNFPIRGRPLWEKIDGKLNSIIPVYLEGSYNLPNVTADHGLCECNRVTQPSQKKIKIIQQRSLRLDCIALVRMRGH